MLENLVLAVNFIRTIFYYGFYISYKTGSFLVSSINTILKYLAAIFENLANFFSALCESLAIFFQDIFQLTQHILVLITSAFETIYSSVATVFFKISLLISTVITLISSACSAVVNGISVITASLGQIVVIVRNLAILLGSGVWFLITLVPLLLYYVCILCISFISTIYQEVCDIIYSGVLNVKTLIKNILLFITDIPIESIAGIIIALSLVYIVNQFYVLIITYFKQQLRKLRIWLRRVQVTDVVSSMFSRQVTRRQQMETPRARRPVRQQPAPIQQRVQARTSVRSRPRVQEKEENSPPTDDKCCVICQERNKCILLLPCRHLCLCTECTTELRYYNEVCPICRTNIESTMKIFV